MPGSGIPQQIHGSFKAQAAEGSIAPVNVYQGVEPAPISAQAAAAALGADHPNTRLPASCFALPWRAAMVSGSGYLAGLR